MARTQRRVQATLQQQAQAKHGEGAPPSFPRVPA